MGGTNAHVVLEEAPVGPKTLRHPERSAARAKAGGAQSRNLKPPPPPTSPHSTTPRPFRQDPPRPRRSHRATRKNSPSQTRQLPRRSSDYLANRSRRSRIPTLCRGQRCRFPEAGKALDPPRPPARLSTTPARRRTPHLRRRRPTRSPRSVTAGSPVEMSIGSTLHTHTEPRKVSLPTYPFERQRHWIEPLIARSPGAARLKLYRHRPCRWMLPPTCA